MAYHKTQGLCIRVFPFSNTSERLTFMTRDAGRLSGLRKGARRGTVKRPAEPSMVLARYEVVYLPARSGGLATITSAAVLEHFRRLHTEMGPFLVGQYACELLNLFTVEGAPEPGYYEDVLAVLRRLDAGASVGLSTLLLELSTLEAHGVLPDFEHCVVCRRGLPAQMRAGFSAAEGGYVCPECPVPAGGVVGVAPAARAALADLARRDRRSDPPVVLAPKLLRAMSEALRVQIGVLADRPLAMWRYLDGRLWRRVLARCAEEPT